MPEANPFDGFIFEFILVTFFGLCFGSFTTALVYRIPRGIPWAFAGKAPQAKAGENAVSAYHSICPSCERDLKAIDLVPFFSWLFLGGKCRQCKNKIPLRYPVVELGVLLSLVSTYLVFGLTAEFVFIGLCLPFLWALLVIDIDYMILPNQLVALLGAVGLVRLGYYWGYERSMTDMALIEHLAGALLFAGFIWLLGWIMSRILKKDSLGFGDVKFFGVAGLWLGVKLLAPFSFLAGVVGIVFALIWRLKTKQEVFPFGPALIISFYLLLLFNDLAFSFLS